eukprot:Amastigsp_a511234_143.p3 type:complete len:261 gc:universal Amastigsp_a511234_143:177-959(+)
MSSMSRRWAGYGASSESTSSLSTMSTSICVFATMLAVRGTPFQAPISPKNEPCDIESKTVIMSSARTSTVPERRKYILDETSPMRTMMSPALKMTPGLSDFSTMCSMICERLWVMNIDQCARFSLIDARNGASSGHSIIAPSHSGRRMFLMNPTCPASSCAWSRSMNESTGSPSRFSRSDCAKNSSIRFVAQGRETHHGRTSFEMSAHIKVIRHMNSRCPSSSALKFGTTFSVHSARWVKCLAMSVESTHETMIFRAFLN